MVDLEMALVVVASVAVAAALVAVAVPTLVRNLREAGLLGGGDSTDSAERLARLLVSEIALYDEEEVRRGREEGDLLRRLGPEIERARAMWRERVGPRPDGDEVFDRVVIDILVEGEPELVGPPGRTDGGRARDLR